MLIDAIRGRFDFPELKAVALEQYKYWQPETTIIEAKASGQPLLQEFRRMGIPVMDFTPGRGKDKHSRVNAVPLFLSLDKSIILEMKNLLKKLLKNVQLFLMENMTIMLIVLHRLC